MPTYPVDQDTQASRDCEQTHEYEYEPGLIYLPIASATPQMPARIRLHGGYGIRRVKWSASRMGGPPVMPVFRKDKDTDKNPGEATDLATQRPFDRVMSSRTIVVLPSAQTDTASYNYVAQGEMVFVQAGPTGPRVPGVDALPTGGRPFYMGTIDDVSAATLQGYTPPNAPGTVRPSQHLSDYLMSLPTLHQRTTGWPTTLYPGNFSSTTIIQE